MVLKNNVDFADVKKNLDVKFQISLHMNASAMVGLTKGAEFCLIALVATAITGSSMVGVSVLGLCFGLKFNDYFKNSMSIIEQHNKNLEILKEEYNKSYIEQSDNKEISENSEILNEISLSHS